MIDHVSIGVADLERASSFYAQVLKPIGLAKLVMKPGTVGCGFDQGVGEAGPVL